MGTAQSSFFRGSDRFRVVERLGSGATGEVFQAVDLGSQARVALKALRQASPELLRLFKREFRAMQDIRHENLVSLGELFEEEGQWFFTMELIEGGTDLLGYVSRANPPPSDALESHVALRFTPAEGTPQASPAEADAGAPFDEARLRGTLKQLVAGLRALHAAGKVHRDVKPSNVLVTRSGRVVVVDFGITVDRRERRGDGDEDFAGTPVYMAPEQALSTDVGPPADWYAVGIVLFQALTGCLPFDGTVTEILSQKVAKAPPAPRELVRSVPDDLNDLCVDLLRIEPGDRPTGDEIARRVGLHPSAAESADGEQVFVGRRKELAALRDAFDTVRSGASMVVFVEGESGVGKTELVRHFLSELEASAPSTLVLRGRSYERESIPYEALDDALDDLSRVLRRPEWAPSETLALLSPHDIAMLGRTFPVLRDALGDPRPSVHAEMPSPRQQRARLFEAMRSMMGCLARRSPLILWIDDLHWADSDSIALLSELLRAPNEPAMLLLCTLRSETAVRHKARDITQEIVRSASKTKVVRIGKLPMSDAEALARQLFKMRGANDAEPSSESVHRILAEAQGHPLFIDELVRQRGLEGEETQGVQLDEVLWRRVRSLKSGARRLLELVAVVGMPISQEIVARAGAIPRDGIAEVVRELQHAHLVRTSGDRAVPLLAPYHDRIRESVVARLDEETLRSAHAQLAVAGEQEKDCDPEFLLAHWDGAGNPKRAGDYARLAADRAAGALAFDHAAPLYRAAIASGAFDLATERDLRARLAEVLTAAGREAEAAAVRLELAGAAATTEALDLRRQAAEQFLLAGHFDRGKALLRDVLARVHERFPDSPLWVIFWLIVVRAQLRLRGTSFTERETAVQDRALVRIDALFSAGAGFAMTDNIRGAYFQTKNLLQAMKAGDLRRVARALAMEVCFRAAGGMKAAPTTLAHLAIARRLAERVGTPDALAMADVAEGYAYFFFGEWARSIDAFTRAEATFRDRCVGAHWQINSSRTMLYRALTYAGRIDDLRQRYAAVLRDAVQRGDRYTALNMKCSAALIVAVADDRPADAQRLLDEARAELPTDGFLVQHYFHLLAQAQLHIYVGAPAEAHAVLLAAMPQIRRSLLTRIAAFEVLTRGLFARGALASAEKDPAGGAAWIAEARRQVEILRRVRVAWARPLATLHQAAILACEGARAPSLALLRTAIEELDATGLGSFAAAARRVCGAIVGGEEGARLLDAAHAYEVSEGVVDREAIARLHAPGFGRLLLATER